jgi:hypothetical protein
MFHRDTGLQAGVRRVVSGAHHVENGYYERFFRNGLTEAQEMHDQRWHAAR